MNSPQSNPTGATRAAGGGDEIHLLDLLDVVLDSRWLIASVMAIAMVLGVGYALFATPVYQANTLIQVEDSKGDPLGSMMGQAAGLFDIRSPASAEIQILRSRLVVDQAVANLGLDIEVMPRKSENQMTQRMVSVSPRLIWPFKMRSPAALPT